MGTDRGCCNREAEQLLGHLHWRARLGGMEETQPLAPPTAHNPGLSGHAWGWDLGKCGAWVGHSQEVLGALCRESWARWEGSLWLPASQKPEAS